MAKVFASNAVLPAADLNTNMEQPGTGGTGTRIVSGTTAYSISSANSTAPTVTYGFTFSAAPKVIAVAQSNSSIDLVLTMQGAPTTTACTIRLAEKDGNTTTVSGNIHWIAIGPP